MKKAVILVGHGGVPKDFPADKISRLKLLEAQRQRLGLVMSQEEQELDTLIRTWPRTPENDPFCFGTQKIAQYLETKLQNTKLLIAYNEFCGPSIIEATEQLIEENYEQITLLSTMFTPGGVHSEFEIPEILAALQQKHPTVEIKYPWPFDLNQVAGLLAAQLYTQADSIL